jgi:hypothetical protein
MIAAASAGAHRHRAAPRLNPAALAEAARTATAGARLMEAFAAARWPWTGCGAGAAKRWWCSTWPCRTAARRWWRARWRPARQLGGGDDRVGEGFRTPAIQAVVWHGAGVRKPPMHEPAGHGRCYGDLKDPLSRRGWRDGRCGWRGDRDVPPDGVVGRRDRSAGVPSTGRDGAGRSDLMVIRAVGGPVIAAGTRFPGVRSTAAWLAGRSLSCRVTTQRPRYGQATMAARAPGRHGRRSR